MNSKKVLKVLYAVFLVFLILVAGIVALSTLKIPGNIKLLVVESGSMEPKIKTGSIVVVKPAPNYKIGDIITAYDSANHKVSVTHRIYEIKDVNGKQVFITKGDANKTADTEERHPEDIVGKAIFVVPFAGYPIGFAKTRDGLIVLIVIPASIIIWSEFINIKNQILRLAKQTKKKAKPWKFTIHKVFILIFFFIASFASVATSRAYYSDTVTTGASLTAATWEDPLKLDFYKETDGNHVGFKVSGTVLPGYDSLDYLITYDTDQTTQGITGTKTVGGATEITEKDLLLGYCTSGGVCVSYTGVKNIVITVTLHKGALTETLTSSI